MLRSPSHGENRGSSPLGSANDSKCLGTLFSSDHSSSRSGRGWTRIAGDSYAVA
jgi:hypothetical protein